MKNIFVTR